MEPRRLAAFALAVMMAAAAPATAWGSGSARSDDWSAMVFGGRFFDNTWLDFFESPDRLRSVDSWIAGGAVSREIGRWPDGLQWEIEGQLVRHFGDQSHWEVNAPLVARWTEFPWNETVRTGVAFGIGPSYAHGDPVAERERAGGTSRFMLYWTIEASAGPPQSPWSLVARLHHRSSGYGLFGETGGSNILALGLRRRF